VLRSKKDSRSLNSTLNGLGMALEWPWNYLKWPWSWPYPTEPTEVNMSKWNHIVRKRRKRRAVKDV
jgi:hypothetical protein